MAAIVSSVGNQSAAKEGAPAQTNDGPSKGSQAAAAQVSGLQATLLDELRIRQGVKPKPWTPDGGILKYAHNLIWCLLRVQRVLVHSCLDVCVLTRFSPAADDAWAPACQRVDLNGSRLGHWC